MRAHQRLGLCCATVALAVGCAGCSDDPTPLRPTGPHPAPTRAADCVDLPAVGGDPGILLGTDWSGERHDYPDTVVVYACVSPSSGGRVRLVVDGTGVRIRPHSVAVDPAGSGVVPFRVTVSPGGSGVLRVQQTSDGVGGDLRGPVVSAEDDGWSLVARSE